MSKELIKRLRDDCDDGARDEAADLIEQQQSWIESLEQNAKDADRLYKELEGELAAAQADTRRETAAKINGVAPLALAGGNRPAGSHPTNQCRGFSERR